jgi:uncharacterized membrane protein
VNTRNILGLELAVMAVLVLAAVLLPEQFATFIARPELYLHAKFVHVLSVTLFFANVVIGTLWETRSLLSRNASHIRFTYQTVAWLDAFFTAPLILVSLLSGLVLGTVLGGIFSMGWLASAFALFVLSGLVWVTLDIPTQYKVKRLFAETPVESETLPPELLRVLRFRLRLNVFAIALLFIVFYLMVHKPELPALRGWLAPPRAPGG